MNSNLFIKRIFSTNTIPDKYHPFNFPVYVILFVILDCYTIAFLRAQKKKKKLRRSPDYDGYYYNIVRNNFM